MKYKMLPVIGLAWLFLSFTGSVSALQNDQPPTDGKSLSDYYLLNEAETAQLDEMLATQQLTHHSLAFERDWDLSTRGKSRWHMGNLQDPDVALTHLAELRQACARDDQTSLPLLIGLLSTANWDVKPGLETYLNSRDKYQNLFRDKLRKPKDIFTIWEKVLGELNPSFTAAISDFKPAQLDSLEAYLISAGIEPEDKDKYEQFFTDQGLPHLDSMDEAYAGELLAKIGEPQIYLNTLKYLAACDELSEAVASLKFTNHKVLTYYSKYGLMVIGTKGDDIYSDAVLKLSKGRKACLLIDPAGDDRYEMQLSAGRDILSYYLLDLAGNDVYRSSSPASMFFSLGGYGVSVDATGDDVYQVDDYAFASLIGSNLHLDCSGADSYRSGLFSQGAASEGIAILCDQAGNDTYQASTLAQGLGFIRGSGVLLDWGGADNYLLGNKYLHAPLMPNDYRSMGQGMGFGARPDFAGGLGLLYDRSGNDHYLGGVYAQGVGYWYATGILLDEAGNDVYNAIYYPQGSGIHLACGFLYDGAGDDAYYSRNGPGQGAGHDWALGMLIDANGNDAYSIQGGNGLGLSNSVGIFVDKKGNDRYERLEAQNYGNATFSRGTGGIGLFLDAGGEDCYSDSLTANNKTWSKGSYGVGRDIALYTSDQAATPEAATDEPLVATDAPIQEVFDAAAEWEVGSAIKRVRAARVVLKDRQDETLEYIVNNKLSTESGLEYRALEAFLDDNTAFKQRLFDFVDDSDSLKAKNAMSLIAGEGDSTLIVPLKSHLANGKYITACISLLGSIKTDESVQILQPYAFHPSERYRYLTARSLNQIGTPAAYRVLSSMKQDGSFLVQALLRSIPQEKL